MVRIDQSVANKLTIGAFVAVAAYVLLLLITRLDGGPLRALMVMTLFAILLYAYRVFRTAAIADERGVVVRNLLGNRSVSWGEVRSISAGPSPKGENIGVNLMLADGTILPVEASWGPWYQGRGKPDSEHAQQCEAWADELRAVASGAGPSSD